MFDHVMLIFELILLVLIWQDGRAMLRSSIKMENMYAAYFDELRQQRLARQESARKARESKAAKAAAEVVSDAVSQVRVDASVDGERPE